MRLAVLIVILIAVIGCTGTTPVESPTGTGSATQIASETPDVRATVAAEVSATVEAMPTTTPMPTPTPAPTSTPAPSPSPTMTPIPTPTSTPVPTATPEPTPTATPTPAPSATPQPPATRMPTPTPTPPLTGEWYTWEEIEELGFESDADGEARIMLEGSGPYPSIESYYLHYQCWHSEGERETDLYLGIESEGLTIPSFLGTAEEKISYSIDGQDGPVGRWFYSQSDDNTLRWYTAPGGPRDSIVAALLGGAKRLSLTLDPGEEYANTYTFSTEGFPEAAKPVLAQCSHTPPRSTTPAPRVTPQATPTPTPRVTPQATPTPRPERTPTPTPEPLMSYREVIDLVHPSIVHLTTGESKGSGFIIKTLDNSAYVATNEHVVEDATGTVTAVVGDRAIYPGLVIGEDDRYDFAVVWICCSDDFKALPLAEDGSYVSGDEVGAFGYPLSAEEMQATWGNFAELEAEPAEGGWDMINWPLNLAPGNSGGPVVNLRGQVIGVNDGAVPNEPYATGVSARAIRQLLPVLIGDHEPDKRNWPAIDWKGGATVAHDGLLELDVTIRQKGFEACDGNTPAGQACEANVAVYIDGSLVDRVWGYECEGVDGGNTDWCIDSSGEEHFYYPSTGRLSVRVLTNLADLFEEWADDDLRWEVCIHSNTEDYPLLGCAPIQWKSR